MLRDELEKKEELLENEEVKEEVVEEPTEEIKNIDLTVFNKKKFSINGDPNKILELDVSDLNIVTRLKEQYPKLEKLAAKLSTITEENDKLSDSELLDSTANSLKELDKQMRECVDTIFDSNVSAICVPTGSMYDPVGGKFRYEHLINIILSLYDENLTDEANKIKSRVSKHTAKYTKKK